MRWEGLHLELLHPPLDLVLVDCVGGPLPLGLETLDQAARGMARQGAVDLGTERQPGRNLCQGGKVQPVGNHFAMCCSCGIGIGLRQLDISARPAQALRRIEREILGGKFQGSWCQFCDQSP